MTFRTTSYFKAISRRLDRAIIRQEWIERARVRRPSGSKCRPTVAFAGGCKCLKWKGHYLRVMLLADGETVPNAFVDRG